MGVSSAVLKRAAQTLRRLPNSNAAPVVDERPYGLSRLCAGLRLRLPVYPHLSLRRSPITTGLGDDEMMGCRMTDDLRGDFV